MTQKDNTTFKQKAALRTRMLKEINNPVILEAYGGWGKLYRFCYFGIAQGVVFEKDPAKAAALASDRPTWAVYECDSVYALSVGLGKHLPVNFVDFDPYGDAWPAIQAFFESDRPRPDKIAVVVNDGLRSKVKISFWDVRSLQGMVSKYGNDYICSHYLEICQELMQEHADKAGYKLRKWTGYYCGHAQQMTHYGAVLEK
jgi:hypothetical protein